MRHPLSHPRPLLPHHHHPHHHHHHHHLTSPCSLPLSPLARVGLLLAQLEEILWARYHVFLLIPRFILYPVTAFPVQVVNQQIPHHLIWPQVLHWHHEHRQLHQQHHHLCLHPPLPPTALLSFRRFHKPPTFPTPQHFPQLLLPLLLQTCPLRASLMCL